MLLLLISGREFANPKRERAECEHAVRATSPSARREAKRAGASEASRCGAKRREAKRDPWRASEYRNR